MKFIASVLLFCMVLGTYLQVNINAEEGRTSYSWYCPHVKDHESPTPGRELSFCEDYNAYYLDPNAAENGDKVLYLTFDAGYENGNIVKILDILEEEGVTAAFFILGNLVCKHPDLIKRMRDEGHAVCNHTSRHKDLSMVEKETFCEELSRLEKVFGEYVGGNLDPFYRPPEGKFSKENLVWAEEMGYSTVFWSFAYPDWDNQKQMTPERAKGIILENIHPGEIMLLHPTSSTNANILKEIIQTLKQEGYRFGSLSELSAKRGVR